MTSTLPMVSIALCTYNGAKYLAQQLDTLVHQTYPNIEIIAVDDCSTDTTMELLNQYAYKYNQIHIYSNVTNIGFNKNFEKAISLCKGEYIAISDQDDIWELNKISLLIGHIGLCDLIYSDSLFIDQDGNKLNRKLLDGKSRYMGADPKTLALFNIVCGHTTLFTKSLAQKVVPIPYDVIYDWWIGLVACNNNGICVLDSCLTLYRQHGSNVSNSLTRRTQIERLIFIEKGILAVISLSNLKSRSFFEEYHHHLKKNITNLHYKGLLFFCLQHWRILTSVFDKNALSRLNHLRHFLN